MKEEMGRRRVATSAVINVILTCAVVATAATSSVLHDKEKEPKIFQVTEKEDGNPSKHRNENSLGFNSRGEEWHLLPNGITTITERNFRIFLKKYNKEYSTRDEYLHRLSVFANNMVRAAENQALDPWAVHGVTPFFDLSEEEFESSFMGLAGGSVVPSSSASHALPMVDWKTTSDGLPENFDWREKGAVTGVKLQGACGSCWAFSTTGVIEGANFIASGKLLSLSEQQLIDCDHTCDALGKGDCNNGCYGGLMTNAYKYLMDAGGLEEESSYPYTGKRGDCKFKLEKVVVKVVNFTNISLNESRIATDLIHNGPLAVGLNAAFMQTYVGGVSCPLICPKKHLNHGVLLVGYGSKGFSLLRLGYQPYWIIKNSWGKAWGEEGYHRLCRGHNMCGINTMVSYATTKIS